jgi:uncharacterized membrane protein (DUF4010 family)
MNPLPLGVIVATLGGLAIGIERQWSGHATGPNARFAGVRTFALLGGAAGISGWLWTAEARALAVVLLAVAGALVVAAYVAASRTEIDATTEVSAIVVLAAGTLAGLGQLAFASGIIAVTTFFLVAVLAAVVLPLLPVGPYGPWQTIRPRETWVLVLLFSAISFGGYIARRSVGTTHGYALTGLLGGLISSTNVTLTFARTSRADPALALPLGAGVVAASTMLFLRVGLATLALHPPLARALLWYLAPPFLLGVGVLALSQRAVNSAAVDEADRPTNPLQLVAALQMAAVFQVVLMGVELTRRVWGDTGVLLSGGLLGLTDVDALTFSIARASASGLPVDVAARAITMGLVANTMLKLLLALVLGTRGFRSLVAVGLSGMAISLAIALVR